MKKTGKEPAEPPAPAPATPALATSTPTNIESGNNYRVNRRGNLNVETKVEQEDQIKKTSMEKLQS